MWRVICNQSVWSKKKKKSFEPIGVYRPLANNEGAKIFFLRPLPGSLKQKHRVLRDAQFLVWWDILLNPSNSRNTGFYMYKCACIHMLTRIHTEIHTHTHPCTHVRTYTHTYKQTIPLLYLSLSHTHIHARTRTHKQPHTHTFLHSHIAMRAHREKESVSEVYSNYTQLSPVIIL